MCDYCHNDAAGAGGGGHIDGTYPASVGGFNRIWNGAADAGTAAAYTAGNGTNGTCAAIDCHNEKSTTTTFDWYDNAALPAPCATRWRARVRTRRRVCTT